MEIKGIFYFDPADRIYQDHFPGNPVVPGSVIVNAFLTAGRKAGLIKEQCTLKNFRFKGFVSPGEHGFSMQMMHDQMKCRLHQGSADTSKTLVTGTIIR